jgi:hypothetical protein
MLPNIIRRHVYSGTRATNGVSTTVQPQPPCAAQSKRGRVATVGVRRFGTGDQDYLNECVPVTW